ncbi:MAG: hypothetical protein ABIR24_06055 [Verrucomicrobiota bacterium]
MKKKILRWLICIVSAVILLALAGILLLDTIAKSVAERRVRAETGMDTKIGKFSIGLRSATIHIENFVLKNPPEFGGETFVEMPELFVEYDRDALRSGKLHLKLVRININQVHVVESKEGKKNVDELQKHPAKSKAPGGSTNKSDPAFTFDAIDTLDVTLKTARFTSFKNPDQNLEHDLGIRHETFKNLKTEKDFQTAAALLTLKAGAHFLLSGKLLNHVTLLKQGANAGKETKNVLEELAEPVRTKTEPTNP